jgi:HD-GYP domain-containing protein (c-di-GMP phosphodiesterase class II)
MEAFRNHPQNAADIARRFSEVPPDVDTIIAQHHERPDGTGFPRRLSGNYIAPLASIFIVAHDLARYSRLRPNEKIDVKEFIKQGALKYKSSQFKKVLAVLEANMSDMGMPEPGQPAA